MKHLHAVVLALAAPTLAAGQDRFAPMSGYEFMEPSTQQLQDDDFLNPAFFLVEQGLLLWDQDWPGGGSGQRSCRSCHGNPETLRGVSARYPAYDEGAGRLLGLSMKLNFEITEKLDGQPLGFDSEAMLALTALIGYQSRGLPMAIEVDARLQGWIDRGEEIYRTKRGQLNLSCRDCHTDHWGEKLRGDTISQGQINAFPIFRLTWDEVGSLQRMFNWCMESIRSEPYSADSDEYLALETYLAWRGAGLSIEVPGVRR